MPGENRLEDTLQMYFDDCAARLPQAPSLEQLCAASSKETRLWARPEVYEDLMGSIREQLDLRPDHRLLEVGCAAGFLAVGLSRMCAEYVGVDLAPMAVQQAARLGIPNARFHRAEGAELPFPAASFDRVLSYDVFTNFPGMELASKVTTEMLRVTADDGMAMLGAIPDDAMRDDYFTFAQEVVRDLETAYGPRRQVDEINPMRPPWPMRLQHWFRRRVRKVSATPVNHLFRKEDFVALGDELGVSTGTLEGHQLSPFRKHRFNVVFSKK